MTLLGNSGPLCLCVCEKKKRAVSSVAPHPQAEGGPVFPELIPGDILLFESDGSCLADLICELDNSKVSHAAMYYAASPVPAMVEEYPPDGVRLWPAPVLPVVPPARPVRVMRHRDPALDMRKVALAAGKHWRDRQPYGYANLITAGCLLLLKRLVPKKAYSDLVMEALTLLCALLAEAINQKMYPGKIPMSCAQFAARCYADAGPEYALRINRATGSDAGAPPRSLALLASDHLQRADLDLSPLPNPLRGAAGRAGPEAGGIRLPAALCAGRKAEDLFDCLCCHIVEYLRKHKTAPAARPGVAAEGAESRKPPVELLSRAADFARLALYAGPDAAPLGGPDEQANALACLAAVIENFVSPGDLHKRCESLKEITP